MDERDTHRRSCSRRRRHQQSPSSLSDSSSSFDSPSRFLRRDRRSIRRNSRKNIRSRSPHKFEHRHGYRRRYDRRSRSRDSRDTALCRGGFLVTQCDNRHGEERELRRIHRVDSAKVVSESRRIAPNASALKSIMLGTARSRDRMDERERARAKKNLENLDATVTQ